MRTSLVIAIAVATTTVLMSVAPSFAAKAKQLDDTKPEPTCVYAGKTYSIGAFLCVSKGIGMTCGAPVLLQDASNNFAAGDRPVSKDVSWQIVKQNNSFAGIQQAGGDMNSRTCDTFSPGTP